MNRQHLKRSLATSLLSLACTGLPTLAQQPAAKPTDPPEPLPQLANRPDKEATEILGPAYESVAHGISLRGPAGSKMIRRGVSADEIVQFVNDAKDWQLKVSLAQLRQPVPLVAPAADEKKGKKGLLVLTREQFVEGNAGAEVLREDVINVQNFDTGMLAFRFTQTAQKRLMQQAIVRVTDEVYYVLTMTSPGASSKPGTADAAAGKDDATDPREREAVETFQAVVDSVKLLDRGAVKEDQDNRLFRTRAFYVNLNADKVKKAVVPEQYLRLIREGKDIGYTYVVEEVAKHKGIDSVLVGIRSYTEPEPGSKVEAESWLISSIDRKREEWSNGALASTAGKKQKEPFSEFGESVRDVKRVIDKQNGVVDKTDEKQPPVRQFDTYSLTVNTITRAGPAEPVKRELAPWYLPQAFGHLLPRLLPTAEAKTYLFATWSADNHEVVARYVDVGSQVNVKLGGGKPERAIPIKDRLGIEGSVTTHYVSPDGKYLGSVAEGGVTILPTDAATLVSIWKTPNLTRPGTPQKPAAAAGAESAESPGTQSR